MRPIAVIPTRFGSTRPMGNALTDINGQPMLAHAWRRGNQIAGVRAASA